MTVREAIGAPLPPGLRAGYDRTHAAARSQLDDATFTAAWTEGQAMPLEQAVAYALAALDSVGAKPDQMRADPAEARPHELTARELEVLRLVAVGLTDPQVAEKLVISRRTVNTHLASIYSKLGVNTRTAAVHVARSRHLL
jgi:DNA-binding NarL/FixJ family response regulator